jgi:hypothetical protein
MLACNVSFAVGACAPAAISSCRRGLVIERDITGSPVLPTPTAPVVVSVDKQDA